MARAEHPQQVATAPVDLVRLVETSALPEAAAATLARARAAAAREGPPARDIARGDLDDGGVSNLGILP